MVRVEYAGVRKAPFGDRVEIELHQRLFAQTRVPRPRLRDGILIEVGVVPALAAAVAAAGGACVGEHHSFGLRFGTVGGFDPRTRYLGEQSFEEGGENPAPLRPNRTQGPIEAGQFDIAPFDHVAHPTRTLSYTARALQKSERPRGKPRPLDGGGGAGSPPQPLG